MKTRAWDLRAMIHDIIFKIPPMKNLKKEETDMFISLIRGRTFDGDNILDIGCGTGDFTKLYPDSCLIIGADISSKMISRAKRKMPKAGFIRADALHLPIKDSSMDFVSMIGLLEYFRDQGTPLSEASRLLRDDGRMAVSFSRPGVLNQIRRVWGIDYFVKDKSEIQKLLMSSDLKILKKRVGPMQTQVLCEKNLKSGEVCCFNG